MSTLPPRTPPANLSATLARAALAVGSQLGAEERAAFELATRPALERVEQSVTARAVAELLAGRAELDRVSPRAAIAELLETAIAAKEEREAPSSTTSAPKKRRGRPRRNVSKKTRAFREKCQRDAPGCEPRQFPAWVYATVKRNMGPGGGAHAIKGLRGIPGAAAVMRAAGGRKGRSLDGNRARVILTLYRILVGLGRKTQRRGYYSRVEGFTTPMLCALFSSPITGRAPCRGSMDASSWGAGRVEATNPDACGYRVALERAGVLDVTQPPIERADPRYVGRVRFVDKNGNARRCAFGILWLRAGP